MQQDNPFSLVYTPDHFCDRKVELEKLKSNLDNGLNTLIHSPRRLGKSALIRHFFYLLEKEKQVDTLYIDLFATRNMQDLIRILADKVLKKFHQKNILQGVQQLLKGLSPTISFDQNGTPKFSIELQESQYDASLEQIFNYLNNRKKKVVIAFDEFQEVANYPEKAEATLRTHILQLSNIRFIFSGSTGHILQEMFLGSKRPFFQSAEILVLDKIDRKIYKEFIGNVFEGYGKSIDSSAIDYLLDFSDVYTYYTELICNQCYSRTETRLSDAQAGSIADDYLESRKFDYLNILNLLSENQKKLVIAIAKAGHVKMPNAMEFLIRYNLPSASSVSQALKVMLEKGILFQNLEGYEVYDVFFKRFLVKYY